MAKAAKPYKEGKSWSMRRRVLGEDLYVSGKDTKTAATEAMKALVEPLLQRGRPKGWGPLETTVAQALQDYGMERLHFLKGAVQDANRLNRWLRAAALATLEVTPNDPTQVAEGNEPVADGATAGQRFLVALKAPEAERSVPRGLGDHRRKVASKSAKSDSVRTRLARMPMADVKRYHVQELVDALAAEGKLPATLRQEQATLRNLFNHARVSWCWAHPVENPATTLKIRWKDNARSRVMSRDEQARLDEAIADCRNQLVGPTITLYTETAMRASEPIAHARWCDVNWDEKVLKLADSKNDKRDVPLSPTAMQALLALKELTGGQPDEPVVSITYEAIKASWGRACERAGVKDLRIQDLRHTAATRLALKSGNVFLVKSLTGHKTLEMLARYVNVTAHDVVEFMHSQPPSVAPVAAAAPANTLGNAGATATSRTKERASPARTLARNRRRLWGCRRSASAARSSRRALLDAGAAPA